MKPYLPFLTVAGLIVGALWYFWPTIAKAREQRQGELDNILNPNAGAADAKKVEDALVAAINRANKEAADKAAADKAAQDLTQT